MSPPRVPQNKTATKQNRKPNNSGNVQQLDTHTHNLIPEEFGTKPPSRCLFNFDTSKPTLSPNRIFANVARNIGVGPVGPGPSRKG